MLSLLQLDQRALQLVAQSVPGGFRNIQDIYPLTALQEGMLLHHALRSSGDTYLILTLLQCRSAQAVDALVAALQAAIDRHDTLRTAILWQGLPRPVQVVYRSARLVPQRLVLDTNEDCRKQMTARLHPELHRLDLERAPLVRLELAEDSRNGGCYALLVLHHLLCDVISLETLIEELTIRIKTPERHLPPAPQFRDHVALTLRRPGTQKATDFFQGMLGSFATPSTPFGHQYSHQSEGRIYEYQQQLPPASGARLREVARKLRVSTAAIFHVACGLTISRTSQLDDVVFGSVFSGRLRAGPAARSTVGMFINTLPLRLQLAGQTCADAVSQTHRRLLELMLYEQIELTVARRCSAVAGSTPLFSVLLNCIRRPHRDDTGWCDAESGIAMLANQAWSNYPVTFVVDDLGDEFLLVSQCQQDGDSRRLLGYFVQATQSLVEALELSRPQEISRLPILPESERNLIIQVFNEDCARRRRVIEDGGELPCNTRVYVLDERLQPVPIGVVADIYLGGTDISAEQWRAEGFAASEATSDPFVADPAARMYRSGLRGRWRPDGTIERGHATAPCGGQQERLSSGNNNDTETDRRVHAPPEGPTEQGVAAIWADTLEIESIGRDQSFFSLGGHSLLGFQLLLKVSERFGVRVPAVSIFRCPTVRQMAQLIDSLSARDRKLADTDPAELEEGVI
jgi:acyl carrier protein